MSAFQSQSKNPKNVQSDCIFCKIVAGAIPAERILETDRFICIRDLHPQAPVHLLIIPKEHIVSLETAFPEGEAGKTQLAGEGLEVATQAARKLGLLPFGFRTVINTNAGGGQSVFHFHIHVLGGGPLRGSFA